MKSQINREKIGFWFLVFGFWLILCLLPNAAFAQSTNQNFPTAITTNEISGTIKARDVGDSRLTSYFYVFNGNQGDIFINVVTKNLDGDIDIFTADNLKPLTKITVYSDNPDGETGRVVYLRQPQKLILRIEGKTPTDEPATFRIKFAGSFQAVTERIAETEESKTPEVKNNEEGEVRVNSVGTIIETKPKPTPTPKPTTAKVEKEEPEKVEEKPDKVETEETETAKKPEVVEKEKSEEAQKETKKFEVVVTENLPNSEKTETVADNSKDDKKAAETDKSETVETVKKRVNPKKPKTSPTTKKETKPKQTPKQTETTIEPGLLENIRLVILFKDGTKIERPMSEVLKVSVDKGILTVISKDGSIGRFSILDVAKMTIE